MSGTSSGALLAVLDAIRRITDDAQLRAVLLPLIDEDAGGWWVRLGALAIAVIVGAVHALGPGHGKVLIGAYLAGSQGRPRDAVGLGGLVAAMHTGVVLVLGALFASAGALPAGETLDAALRVAAGTAVSGVGAWMVLRGIRQPDRDQVRTHGPGSPLAARDGSNPGPEPASGHGHDHDLPTGVAPLSRAGVAAVASAGGLLPSPAAFLVLAAAIATGRTSFGLALVGAFSVGLAVTLAAVGLAVLWGRDHAVRTRHRHPAVRWLAVRLAPIGGVVVLLGGLVLVVGGLLRL